MLLSKIEGTTPRLLDLTTLPELNDTGTISALFWEWSVFLAHPQGYVLFLVHLLKITVRPVISELPGLIRSLGLVELWLQMISLKLVFNPSRDVAVATNFCWFYPHN